MDPTLKSAIDSYRTFGRRLILVNALVYAFAFFCLLYGLFLQNRAAVVGFIVVPAWSVISGILFWRAEVKHRARVSEILGSRGRQ